MAGDIYGQVQTKSGAVAKTQHFLFVFNDSAMTASDSM